MYNAPYIVTNQLKWGPKMNFKGFDLRFSHDILEELYFNRCQNVAYNTLKLKNTQGRP